MNLKAPSTHKKVLVEMSGGSFTRGTVNPRHFDGSEAMEFLDEQGQLRTLPWRDIRAVWFVTDWDQPLPVTPRLFPRRPRLEGLWVRLRFRDAEPLDGILVNNLLHLSPHGYLLTPPGFVSGHQKVFVPKAALTEMQVLGVIPAPGARRRTRVAPASQPFLFGE